MISVTPCRRKRSTMWCITGLLAIGASGLGRREVNGRKRDPSPPAMTTALMGWSFVIAFGPPSLSRRTNAREGGDQASRERRACDLLHFQWEPSPPVGVFGQGTRDVDRIRPEQDVLHLYDQKPRRTACQEAVCALDERFDRRLLSAEIAPTAQRLDQANASTLPLHASLGGLFP